MEHKVSVLMSIYKEPIDWIRQSIESIINQTYTDYEFIIVNDNPDYFEAKNLLNKFKTIDDRIIVIENKINIGLTKSLNIALNCANGKYIARMDADDIAIPTRFLKQINVLENNSSIGVCATNTNIINENGDIILKNNYDGMLDISWLFIDNPIAHSSVMFRKELMSLRIPLYNESFRSAQDFELWSYLLLHRVKFYFISEPLLLYRKSTNQISSLHKDKQLANSKKAHRTLIINYLSHQLGLNLDIVDAKLVLSHCKRLINFKTGIDKEIILKIVYLAYFNLATKSFYMSIKYLFDRHRLIFRLPLSMSKHIILAKWYKNRISKNLIF